jgi:serine/threonine protein kinase
MSSFPTDRNNTESYLLAGIPSRQVGEYILQERLGSGSFATVFKAVKLKSQGSKIVLSEDESTVAAIKVINRQSDKMTKKGKCNNSITYTVFFIPNRILITGC